MLTKHEASKIFKGTMANQYPYYGGIDLHAKPMDVCILDDSAKNVYQLKISCPSEGNIT